MNPPSPRGACPTLAAPMAVADGLLARFRPAHGLTPAQMGVLGRAAEAFGNGRVEITARGSVQVRGLSRKTEEGFREALDAAGIEAKTGIAIEISPIAGEDPEEIRDPRLLADRIGAACERAAADGPLSPKLSIVLDSGGQVSLLGFKADIRLTVDGDGWAIAIGGVFVATLAEDAVPGAVAEVLARLQAVGPRARGRDLGSDIRGAGLASLAPSPPAPLPRGERGAKEPIHSRSPLLPSWEKVARPKDETDEGAAIPAPITVLALQNNRTGLRIGLPFGQLRGEQFVDLGQLMAAHGVAEARPAPERTLVLIGASEALTPALAAVGFGAPGFPLCSGAEAAEGGVIHAADVARALTGAAPDLMDGSVHLHVSTCAKGCAYAGRRGIVLAGNDLAIYRGAAQKPFARLDPGAIEAGLVLLARRIREGRKSGETTLEFLERHDAI